MPLSTYMKLTNERPAETNIRLLLASHSYIYPLGITEDVLVEVAEHVYPVDFVILDIKEDEKRSFILGTPFLTTAKAVIKFDKGTITLRSGKIKISFHRIPDSLCKIERGVKNDIEPIASTITVNRLVLEWEERIKLHLEREMKFNQWRSENFKSKHPALVEVEGGMDDEGEVTLYLIRRILEVLRKFHWIILGERFNQLSHVSSPLLNKPGGGVGGCYCTRTRSELKLSKFYMVRKMALIIMVASIMVIPFGAWKDYLIIDRIDHGQWRWNWSRPNLGA
ncbi:reverse transcriptase domain-containing protein [Tanacetum coccineum]